MVEESRDVLKLGGNIAGNARRELESVTGRNVIRNIPKFFPHIGLS